MEGDGNKAVRGGERSKEELCALLCNPKEGTGQEFGCRSPPSLAVPRGPSSQGLRMEPAHDPDARGAGGDEVFEEEGGAQFSFLLVQSSPWLCRGMQGAFAAGSSPA